MALLLNDNSQDIVHRFNCQDIRQYAAKSGIFRGDIFDQLKSGNGNRREGGVENKLEVFRSRSGREVLAELKIVLSEIQNFQKSPGSAVGRVESMIRTMAKRIS